MTDDWKKSNLYSIVKKKGTFSCVNGYSQEEVTTFVKKLPSNTEECYVKAMNTLVQLLVDMLGTKEDTMEFKEKFSLPTKKVIGALLRKCSKLFAAWKMTYHVIELVTRREKLLRKLTFITGRSLKNAILDIYSLNREIRKSIEDWVNSSLVPFKAFVFNKWDYLKKITDDNLELQRKLSIVCRKDDQGSFNQSTYRINYVTT